MNILQCSQRTETKIVKGLEHLSSEESLSESWDCALQELQLLHPSEQEARKKYQEACMDEKGASSKTQKIKHAEMETQRGHLGEIQRYWLNMQRCS